jgi:hypothetical protein
VRKLGLPASRRWRLRCKDVDMFLYLHKKHAALVPKIWPGAA